MKLQQVATRTGVGLLLAIAATFSFGDSVIADGPPPGIPPVPDVTSGKVLLLDVHLSADDQENVSLISYNFREDLPYPGIADQWIWASRLLSFDNRCLKLSPMGDPRIISLGPVGELLDKQLGRREGTTEFRVEIVAHPDMHELEIINSSYETLAKLDLTEAFDNYCDENSQDSLCAKRRSRLITLDDPAGLEQYAAAVKEDFSSAGHITPFGNFAGGKIVSSSGERGVVIDLAKTSQSSHLFETPYAPFGNDLQHVVYNGHSVVSDNGLSTGKDLDGSLFIEIPGGSSGIAMTLGTITYESIINNSKKISQAASQFNLLDPSSDIEAIRVVAESITVLDEQQTAAVISVSNLDGDPIERVKIDLVPLPGFHTFVGIVTPYDSIGLIEIEYQNGVVEEAFTNLLVLPPDADKLPSMDFAREYQPCSGKMAFAPSQVRDFPTISELEIRNVNAAPVAPDTIETVLPAPATPKSVPSPTRFPEKTATATPTPRAVSDTTSNPSGGNCNARSDEGYLAGNMGLLVIPLALYIFRRRVA